MASKWTVLGNVTFIDGEPFPDNFNDTIDAIVLVVDKGNQ